MDVDHLCERLLVGASASVHVVHLHSYLRLFRESFAKEIRIIMTSGATRMVRPETIALYADDRIFVDLWDRSALVTRAPHIQLTRWADLFLVLPATANTIGKVAAGIADDLLSTAILSAQSPVVFAPAMNPRMWESRVVRRNVATLKSDGHYIVPPISGMSVTSGEWDEGLGPSPETILPHLQHVRMRALRDSYWDEATSTPPRTPAQQKLQSLATAAMQRAATGGVSHPGESTASDEQQEAATR